MMHRSRLCSILLDCSADTMEAGVRFWQQALGTTVRHADDPTSPYVTLAGGAGGLQLYLQRVHDPSRIHLDIETDNVEAEVQRLEQLGYREFSQARGPIGKEAILQADLIRLIARRVRAN